MSDSICLGIDVGTTGAKALLIDADGAVLAEATSEYPLDTPRPLWAEQDPQRWFEATLASITGVLEQAPGAAARVAAIGLTGQMHGLVLLDEHGQVLRPAILWNDQRTGPQCDEITRLVGRRRLLQLTGNPVLPGFTAPKLVWVRRHEPDLYARVAHVLLPKDYVRYRLTGELVSDVSDASGTALFDVGARRWSDEMLAALEIPPGWLPEVVEPPVVCARLGADAARRCGLPAGVPVAGGAGDQAAQAVGTGIVHEGLVSATLGTSGVVFAASQSFRIEPDGRLHAFCHAVPGMWHLMGVMLSAAGSLRWYRDALGAAECEQARAQGTSVYELLTAQAAQVPPGCEGLFFLPYLTGERTPHPDPHARGAFVGLTLRHNKAHLTRAVLEGVGYGMCDSLSLMRELGLTVERVRASGGGARSGLWRQIMADVFGCAVETLTVTQGAAYGAALLAGVAAGVYADVPGACKQALAVADLIEPGPAAATYARLYPLYRGLYPALADHFAATSAAVETA